MQQAPSLGNTIVQKAKKYNVSHKHKKSTGQKLHQKIAEVKTNYKT